MLRSLVVPALIAALLALAGCPSPNRHTLVPTVPTTGDASARDRFLEARARFEHDGDDDVATESAADFARIAADFPDDPIAPWALLYAGIAALESGDHRVAVARFTELDALALGDDGLRRRGALFEGVARARLGDSAGAQPLLARGEAAIENDDERRMWLDASATAAAASPTALDALPWLDALWAASPAAEQVAVMARLQALVGAADGAEARRAFTALIKKDGPAAVILGARVAADYAAAGETARAKAVEDQIAALRTRFGITGDGSVIGEEPSDGSNLELVGALLPVTGNRSRVGELAARTLGMVAASHDVVDGAPPAFQVKVRDTASSGPASAEAIDALVADGAVAAIGPADGEAALAAAARAMALGLPLVTLHPRAPDGDAGRFVFHAMHSAEDRARALAGWAYAAGVRSFAVLYPDNGYGRAVLAAFHDAVIGFGGTIDLERAYPADSKTFVETVKKLGAGWQALFVPDQADKLELIAPALAAAGYVSMAPGGKKPKRGSKYLLLSTAEGAGDKLVRSAGRHTEGAVLAPGFFPDRQDALIGAFVARYEELFAKAPTAIDAYAWDAALVIRAAVGAGAHSRAGVADAIAAGAVDGLTGAIRFGADHHRADPGLLFQVQRVGEGDDADFTARALR